MFEERRSKFMDQMQGGAALLFSAPEQVRSNDTHHRFRQDSAFHYLTGFEEPGAVVLLLPDHPRHRFVMFVRPRDPERETWDGRRAGPEGVKKRYGADTAHPLNELSELLPGYLENVERLHYAFGRHPSQDSTVLAALDRVRAKSRQGIKAPSVILDPSARLDEMRLFKSSAELERMRRAAAISAEAHTLAMQTVRPGIREYEIEALIEYTFRSRGAAGPAYNTIVGSGVNATILHYIENCSACADGELLLVDAGAEFEGYSADITRTYPVNGRFNPAQKELYELVLRAQLAAIDRVRPGVGFDEVHEVAVRTLVEGMVGLGILSGDVSALIGDEAYKPFYMHKTSHWLGLDVHDVGDYRVGAGWRTLEPGMVLTVEPGLYFAEDRTDVPEVYRGTGIRVEDDVLVTSGDPEVLSAAVPKTAAELESIQAGSPAEPAPA